MSEYVKPCGCDEDEKCDVCRPPRTCMQCRTLAVEIERLRALLRFVLDFHDARTKPVNSGQVWEEYRLPNNFLADAAEAAGGE